MNDNDFDEQLCKRLDAVEWRNHELYKLGDMLRRAVKELKNSSHNSRVQAAHLLREVLEKLLEYATEDKRKDKEFFDKQRRAMKGCLLKYTKNRDPDILDGLLTRLDGYLNSGDNPPRRQKLVKALGNRQGVDPQAQKEMVDLVMNLWEKLNICAHHQDNPPSDVKKIMNKLKNPLRLILDNLEATRQKLIKEIQGYNE